MSLGLEGRLPDEELVREPEIDFGDAAVCLGVSLGLEGRLPDEELVAEHAQAPQVHLLVVHFTLDHLRRQVV